MYSSCHAEHKFKAIAFRKVVTALASFAPKIASSNLKEVGGLAGVGKGSLGIIKEWAETGKVQELEAIRAGGGAGGSSGDGGEAAPAANANAAPKSAAAEVALKFM